MFIGETGSISVRLRLCGGRSTSEAALLSVMYGFTIDAYFLSARWNPYGGPPPVPTTLGGLNAPVVPPVDSIRLPRRHCAGAPRPSARITHRR